MADGEGCKCAAYSESECACDADWTPQELIDARAEIERLRLTDAERDAVLEAAGCYVAECDELQAAGVVVDAKRLAVRDTLRGLLERTK